MNIGFSRLCGKIMLIPSYLPKQRILAELHFARHWTDLCILISLVVREPQHYLVPL